MSFRQSPDPEEQGSEILVGFIPLVENREITVDPNASKTGLLREQFENGLRIKAADTNHKKACEDNFKNAQMQQNLKKLVGHVRRNEAASQRNKRYKQREEKKEVGQHQSQSSSELALQVPTDDLPKDQESSSGVEQRQKTSPLQQFTRFAHRSTSPETKASNKVDKSQMDCGPNPASQAQAASNSAQSEQSALVSAVADRPRGGDGRFTSKDPNNSNPKKRKYDQRKRKKKFCKRPRVSGSPLHLLESLHVQEVEVLTLPNGQTRTAVPRVGGSPLHFIESLHVQDVVVRTLPNGEKQTAVRLGPPGIRR